DPLESDPLTIQHCTNSSRDVITTDADESEANSESELQTEVHTAVITDASRKTVACRSRSPGRSPGLMIVEAQTYNFNTKADELLTIFLDSGSQHSFIRKETAKSLGLKLRHPQDITAITFGGHQHTETSYEVRITLQNPVTGTPVKLKLWTRSYITSVPEEEKVNTTLHKPSTGDTADVDILIGMDYYWSVIDLNHNQKLPSGLVKSYTKLGPILSGPNAPFPQINSTLVEQKESSSETDSMVRRLLALDSADADEDRDTTDSEIIQQYKDTVQMRKGIIHVKFPWKANHPPLPDNKALAMRRLESQYRKLHVNPKIWSEYCNTFEQQLKAGIIEDITGEPPVYKSFVPFERTNSYPKLVRITAYALKFIAKLRSKVARKRANRPRDENSILSQFSTAPYITSGDWKIAELTIIREHYRELPAHLESRSVRRFQIEQSQDGIYRGRSRMGNARTSAAAKSPILLLPSHPLTRMVVMHYHLKLLHAGLGYLSSPNTAVTARDPFTNTDYQEYLVCQYSLLRDSLKTFWDLWHTEHLRVLAERNQLRSKNQQSTGRSPQVGDVVLIQTDNTSRSNWPLGVIVQTNPSADGSIRSVAVKLGSQKVLNRSVNQLIPLEVAAEDKDSIKKPTPRTPTRIQPPRKAKKQFIR
ncbi:unnamed protein product, partial [Heligmosomoides polygyrus]|uniref:DUF1758 domain-containing protein n=1 Tax=Heligmosomoides polygyrus TaxID=6339 RepID=A0A183G828_HELPZ